MKQIVLFLLVLLSIAACKKSDDINFPPEIDQVVADLTKSFDTINLDLSASANSIALNPGDTAQIRDYLQEMYGKTSFAQEFVYVSAEKILQLIEPPHYYSSQGTDIGDQAHVIKTFETKLPVLSQSFSVVEGYNAAVLMHPVLLNGQMQGAVAAVFLPNEILGRVISPYVSGQLFEIWVMEAGGNVLYDQDEEEIGLNVITDPLYADFPELIAAAKLIDKEDSGETTYSFFQTGTSNKVTKKTYWKTLKILDNEWKIVWVKPM